MKSKNLIIRKTLTFFLIIALVFTGLFSFPMGAYAEKTVLSTETYYHLDMGVQIAYAGDEWEGRGYNYGLTYYNLSTSVEFPTNIELIDAYPLSSTKGSYFDFDGATSSTNIPRALKIEMGTAASAYDKYYKNRTSTDMKKAGVSSSSGNEASFSYNALFSTKEPFEVVFYGFNGYDNEVWKLFDGKDQVSDPLVKAAIENALLQGKNNTANGNKLYLVFCPTVIEYKKYVTVGDLEAQLTIPASAKQEESYTALDSSYIDSSLTVEEAVLEKHYGAGDWEEVATWEGSGTAGQNTGQSISQTCPEICTITYRLTVTTTNGQIDTDTKTIEITDNREINAKAILELPEYTYEGHKAIATDVSEFEVEGVNYSARRAYEEGVGANKFVPLSGYGSSQRESKTTANITFSKRGKYNVRLDVNTIDGKTLSDTKPIEVRKTPYIIDNLGGFQKQNRKQTLNLIVATYPGKPITDYYVELTDLKTNQTIKLTAANPQVNNATIKTRAIKTSGDDYFTNYELEFLTKTPCYNSNGENQGQYFRYKVYMQDSKGDTDSVQKDFVVWPDMPPQAKISVADSFIRNKGTNTAEIRLEDATTTDGDQVERTWSTSNTDITKMPGYKDSSFGTKQKIQYNKTGVGQELIKLYVKDIWNEPTLEEYVTEADRLSSSTTAITEVINIAPTVKLEMSKSQEADIVFLTSKASESGIKAGVNNIKAALIEAGIDPSIQLIPIAEPNTDGYRLIDQIGVSPTVNCQTCRSNANLLSDSEYFYMVQSNGKEMSGYQEICIQPHTLKCIKPADPLKGQSQEIVWSYVINESTNFSVLLDNEERYAYINCADTNKTILLNRNTGAYVTSLDGTISGQVFVTPANENIYFANNLGIGKLDSNTGTQKMIYQSPLNLYSLKNGKIMFLTSEGQSKYKIGYFDMNSETIQSESLPIVPKANNISYWASGIIPTDIDMDKNIVFQETYRNQDGDCKGGTIWVYDSENKSFSDYYEFLGGDDVKTFCTGFIKDEVGRASYAYRYSVTYSRSNSKTRYYHALSFHPIAKANNPIGIYSKTVKSTSTNTNGPAYARYDSNTKNIYLMIGTDYGWNGLQYGDRFIINTENWAVTHDSNGALAGWDCADETASYKEFLSMVYFQQEAWTGMSGRLKIFKNSITKDQAKEYAITTKLNRREDSRLILEEDFSGDIKILAEKIKTIMTSSVEKLCIIGDKINLATLSKSFKVEPANKYIYEYKLKPTSSSAIDLISINESCPGGAIEGKKVYRKLIASADYSSNHSSDFFKAGASYGLNLDYGYAGLGASYKHRKAESYSAWLEFDMAEDGYVEFDYFRWTDSMYVNQDVNSEFYLDGVRQEYHKYSMAGKRLFFINSGHHRFDFYGSETGCIGFNNVKAYYLYDSLEKADNNSLIDYNQTTGEYKISGAFNTKPEPIYKTEKLINYEAYNLKYPANLLDPEVANYVNVVPDFGCSEAGKYIGLSTGKRMYSGALQAKAPEGKVVAIYFEQDLLSIYGQSFSGERYRPRLLVAYPGKIESQNFTVRPPSKNRTSYAIFKNVRVYVFDEADVEGCEIFHKKDCMTQPLEQINKAILIDFNGESNSAEKITNILNTSIGEAEIKFGTENIKETSKFEIRDLKIYKLVNGIKQLVLEEMFNSEIKFENEVKSRYFWQKSETGQGKVSIASSHFIKDEEAPLVYKKGQLVSYNIFYDDYEKDPSKKQYWLYTHTPMNDGTNKDAAIVCDEDGAVVKIGGNGTSLGALSIDEAFEMAKKDGSKTLDSSIPRFYIDGKYTVYHWQEDNTNRNENNENDEKNQIIDDSENPLNRVDYKKYDKLSNVEQITFYVEGGGLAPWITFIKTLPEKVKAGDLYKLQIGVDDAEKDVLHLTTEVYKDKKLIFTHRQTNIEADKYGNYQPVTTGVLPLAESGKYQVVCTVRDLNGSGLGQYNYTVVSEGRITGEVNHTEKWEQNRKKYNLKRFDEEVNRKMLIGDYKAMTTPRKRGQNVFWSGEKFVITAKTLGEPESVDVSIYEFDSKGLKTEIKYKTVLHKNSEKTKELEEIWEGELWDKTMINRWGRKSPEELLFLFTANYKDKSKKNWECRIIVDSKQDYWQLHRLW